MGRKLGKRARNVITERLSEVSESLLAYLHLSPAEAAVFLDQRTSDDSLVVHIYDKEACRRVRSLNEWLGYPVSIIRDVNLRTTQR
jgi:hypothetical protein